MTTKTRKQDDPKKAPKKFKPEQLIHIYRQTCDLQVWQHGPKKFVWYATQSFNYYDGDEPQEGDLEERGEAKTFKDAVQAAFDALADHLDIE